MAQIVDPITADSKQKADALILLKQGSLAQTEFREWYKDGTDIGLYEPARRACRGSKAYLLKHGALSAEEKDLLAKQLDYSIVQKCLDDMKEALTKERDSKSAVNKAWHFLETASKFGVNFSAVIRIMIPQSPEYTVTYGILVMLLEAVQGKRDREESLLGLLEDVSHLLPLADFYKELHPTNELKKIVAIIYMEIMSMLQEAVVYYRRWRLSRLVDAILHPIEETFASCKTKIQAAVRRMVDLKDVAHAAQQTDMKTLVEATALIISDIHERLEASTAAFGSGFNMLNQKLENIEESVRGLRAFHATDQVHRLRELLMQGEQAWEMGITATPYQPRTSPQAVVERRSWEDNGILEWLADWSAVSNRSLLWIGGRSGDRLPWVTEFSLDLIAAIQTRDIFLAYEICGEVVGDPVTPKRLVKHLILQCLEQNPALVFQEPEVFHASVFRRARSFEDLFFILQRALEHFDAAMIVLDRIDMCKDDQDADLASMLMPSLLKLASERSYVDVVVTDGYEPPPADHFEDAFTPVWIDTSIRPHARKHRLI